MADEKLASCSAANIDETYTDDESEVPQERMPLSLLFKFIKPFNGNRNELLTFVQNCNSAYQLAQPNQTNHLFLYIVSQLSSNVVNEINLEEISSWTQLKIKLKSYYSQERDLTQLHEELETSKQLHNESITQFYKRLENLKNECISAETTQSKDPIELSGIKRSIQRTTLRRFILHCHPAISQMLRARTILTLNEALAIALQEEKIQNYTKPQTKTQNSLYCSFCKKHNHSTQHCKKKPQNNSTNTQSSFQQNYSKFCNYCKNKGHEISECRKRQYREAQKQLNPRINNLNLNHPQEANAHPEDHQIQEAFNSE